MKDWHRAQIFASLAQHGWSGPVSLIIDSYEVGEAYAFSRSAQTLHLRFVADLGAGFQSTKSLEAAISIREDGSQIELWLARRRDSKWQQSVSEWASRASLSRT